MTQGEKQGGALIKYWAMPMQLKRSRNLGRLAVAVPRNLPSGDAWSRDILVVIERDHSTLYLVHGKARQLDEFRPRSNCADDRRSDTGPWADGARSSTGACGIINDSEVAGADCPVA